MNALFHYTLKNNIRTLFVAFLASCLIFSGVLVQYAYGEAVTLTVTVTSSLTFTTTSNNFGSLTAGTARFATTTLSVSTNNVAGWNVTLYGDDQSPTNTVCDLDSDASVGITDQAEWAPGAATTTAGNAVRISSFDSSGDVLALRVMTASGSVPFRASSWWGTTDAYADSATSLWAGIASSTVQRQIGNAGTGSYSASAHLSTVLYYLDVPGTQQAGAYSCPLTFTATAN